MSAWDEIEGLTPEMSHDLNLPTGHRCRPDRGRSSTVGTTLKLAAGVFLPDSQINLRRNLPQDVYKHKEQLARAIAAAGAAPLRLAAASLKRIRNRSAGSRVFLWPVQTG